MTRRRKGREEGEEDEEEKEEKKYKKKQASKQGRKVFAEMRQKRRNLQHLGLQVHIGVKERRYE